MLSFADHLLKWMDAETENILQSILIIRALGGFYGIRSQRARQTPINISKTMKIKVLNGTSKYESTV